MTKVYSGVYIYIYTYTHTCVCIVNVLSLYIIILLVLSCSPIFAVVIWYANYSALGKAFYPFTSHPKHEDINICLGKRCTTSTTHSGNQNADWTDTICVHKYMHIHFCSYIDLHRQTVGQVKSPSGWTVFMGDSTSALKGEHFWRKRDVDDNSLMVFSWVA